MHSGQTSFFAILFISIIFLANRCHSFDIDTDIIFRLYTRNFSSYAVLSPKNEPPIAESVFTASRQTRIFVHGFRSKEKVLNRYADAYLKADDYNFIGVDWTKGANVFNYYTAKNRVKHVSGFCFRCNIFVVTFLFLSLMISRLRVNWLI